MGVASRHGDKSGRDMMLLEMGGSGSKVTPFNSTEQEDSSKHAENFTEITALSNRIKELEEQLELKNEASRSTDDKLQASQHQVELLCTEILGLQESLASRESSSRSVSALEHMVRQLRAELANTQTELQEMRGSYEKRLQRIRSSSAKSQAESALSLYELRDDNQRLETENEKLSKQISQKRESSNDSCGHMSLIVELSQQLTTSECELKQAQLALKELGVES